MGAWGSLSPNLEAEQSTRVARDNALLTKRPTATNEREQVIEVATPKEVQRREVRRSVMIDSKVGWRQCDIAWAPV